MKLIKLLPLLVILTFYNSSPVLAESCADIKADSSVNIFKKLKCKVTQGDNTAAAENTENSTSTGEKKKGILGKLFKKPKWVK